VDIGGGEVEGSTAGRVAIREDIDAVFVDLDPKGQSSLTGLRTPRQVRKGLQKLPELLSDERVLGLAVGSDPPPTASEQRSMGAGAAFGEITQTAASARLLVITETNLWEVQASGRLNGSRPKGICSPLCDVTDVRTLAERKLGRFGAKQRILAIDHLRGAQVETRIHEISGSDETLESFAGSLARQVAVVSEAITTAERHEATPQISVADELTKLSNLLQSGILSDAEFSAQKAKLLENS
jgi:hypothetical protein